MEEQSRKTSFVGRFKNGFFESFHYLETFFAPGTRMMILFELISSIQLLSFVFFKKAYWHGYGEGIMGTVITLLSGFRLDLLLHLDGVAEHITFFGVLIIVFVFVVVSIYVWWDTGNMLERGKALQSQDMKASTIYKVSRTIFAVLYSLLSSVLYIPVLSILCVGISCFATEDHLDAMSLKTCAVAPDVIEGVLCIFALVTFVVLILATKLIHFMQGAYEADYMFLEIGYLAVKTIIVCFFQFQLIADASPLFLCAVYIALTAVTLYSFFTYLPFYNFTTNQVRCTVLALQLWAGVCLAVTIAEHDQSQAGPMWMLFIGSVVACLLGWMIVHSRKEKVLNKLPSSISSPLEMNLKIRIALDSSTSLTSVDDLLLKGVDEKDKALEDETHRTVITWMKQFCAAQDSSLGHCFLMNLCMQYPDYEKDGIRELYRLLQQNLRFDLDYLVYRQNKNTAAKMKQNEEADKVLFFLAIQKGQEKAIEEDLALAHEQIGFWSELLSKHPVQNVLTALSGRIRTKTVITRNIYESLLKRSDNMPSILELYGNFLINSTNDEVSGNALINRAKAIQAKNTSSQANRDQSIELYPEDATLSVVSKDSKTAYIEDASAGCGALFCCQPQVLVGTSLFSLFPDVIGQHHAGHMTGDISKDYANGVETFVNHPAGVIVPVFMFAREVPTISDKHNSIVVLRDISRHCEHLTRVCLINIATMQVTAATGLFCDMFDMDPKQLEGSGVKVSALFPFMKPDEMSKIEKDGYSHKGEHLAYNLTLEQKNSEHPSGGYYCVKIERIDDGTKSESSNGGRRSSFAYANGMNQKLEKASSHEDQAAVTFGGDVKKSPTIAESDDDFDEDNDEDKLTPFDEKDDDPLKKIKTDQKSNVSSSAASTAPERQFLKSLRAALIDDGIMLPVIRRFFYIFLLSTVVICGTAIFAYVFMRDAFATYESHANLNDVGHRRLLSCNMAMQADTLAFINEGSITDDAEHTLEKRSRYLLNKDADYLEKIEVKLRKIKKDEEHERLYIEPLVDLTVSREGKIKHEFYNLRDAEQKIIYSARATAAKPLANISNTPSDPDTFLVTKNGADAIVEALNNSVELFVKADFHEIDFMEEISLILMIFALVIIVGVNVFVIYPTIKAVEDGKNAVLNMFMDMPKATLRQLRAMSVDRFEYLSKLVKDSGEGVDVNILSAGDGGAVQDDDSSGSSGKRRGLSAFKLSILLRIGVFSIVAGGYFILSHTEALSRYHYRLLQSPQKVNFAEYRIAGVTRLLHLTRAILIADRYVNYTSASKKKKALEEIQLFSEFNSDLLYGSNNDGGGPRKLIPKEAYKSEGHLKLLFEDACYEITDATKKKACEEFDYGLMTGGLQAGLLKMVFLAKNVVTKFYDYVNVHTYPLEVANLNEIMSDPDWLQLYAYVQHILPDPIDDSLIHYNDELKYDLDYMTLLRLEFLLILLGVTLGLWVFVFYPLTKTLNNDIMNSNSMILMIPSDVIRTNPKIREFILKFSKRNTV